MTASVYWLIFGIVCLAFEAFGVTGVGLFFAGLGAFAAGIVIELGLVGTEAYIAQFAWFFGATVLFAILLWRPMQNWRINRQSTHSYNNMVGERATVTGEALVKNKEGKVSWSGTTMIAELVSGSPAESVAVGETVYIKNVKGNKLFVDLN